MSKGFKYSPHIVRKILGDYQYLCALISPDSDPDYGIRVQKSHKTSAPYEDQARMKADMDRAFRKLYPTQLNVVLSIYVWNVGYKDLGFWLSKDYSTIREIEEHAVKRMVSYLNNGELD